MASTYSNLKIELMGTGDQSGTWGVTTNTNLGTAIEEAITGTADVSFSSADVTLTLTNTNTAQTARNLRLNLTGTVGAPQNLIVPAIEKQYIINNGLTFAITVKNATGTGVSVPAGKSMIVFNTGSDVVDTTSHLSSLTLGSALPVTSGGTGVTTSTGSTNVVLSASPTLTGTPLAPTAAPGTNTTQIATTAFVQNVAGALGTMSTQNANAVAITGGNINGTTIGGTTAAVGTFSTLNTANAAITGGTITGITDLAVADGGTGASTLSANAVLLGNGTSALQTVAPSTSGNVLTSNGTTWTSAAGLTTTTGSAPYYGARAWVNFDGTGTVAIRGSVNVSSITDNGAGDYTINFTTAMPDANYAAIISGSTVSNGSTVTNPALSPYSTPQAPTTTTVRVGSIGTGGNGNQADVPYMFVAVFR
jgi:hypothetical protein